MRTFRTLTMLLLIGGLSACQGNSNKADQSSSALDPIQALQSLRPQVSQMESDPSVADPYICGNNGVLICHFPPGNPDNKHSLCIGSAAIQHHIKEHQRRSFGDYLGACIVAQPDSGSDSGSGSGSDSGSSDSGTDGSTDSGTGDSGSGGGDTQFLDCTDPANHLNPLCL